MPKRDSLYLLLAAVAAPALIGNTVFFHQAHLTELRGWAPAVFATAFSVYAVTTVVFNVLGGFLVDRVTALRLVPVYLLPLGAGLVVLALAEGVGCRRVHAAVRGHERPVPEPVRGGLAGGVRRRAPGGDPFDHRGGARPGLRRGRASPGC